MAYSRAQGAAGGCCSEVRFAAMSTLQINTKTNISAYCILKYGHKILTHTGAVLNSTSKAYTCTSVSGPPQPVARSHPGVQKRVVSATASSFSTLHRRVLSQAKYIKTAPATCKRLAQPAALTTSLTVLLYSKPQQKVALSTSGLWKHLSTAHSLEIGTNRQSKYK